MYDKKYCVSTTRKIIVNARNEDEAVIKAGEQPHDEWEEYNMEVEAIDYNHDEE